MKRILTLIAVALVAYPVCIPTQLKAQNRIGAASLRPEAEHEAHLFWNSRMSKCSQDYYTRDRIYIHEFRNLNIIVDSRFVSGADRLNGIEWRGSTKLTVGQSRTYNAKAGQNGSWSQWA